MRAGGLNRYAEGLARALAEVGVEQRWFVMGKGRLVPSGPYELQAVASPDTGLLRRWRAMRAATRPAFAGRPDLATSHFALYAYAVRRRLARLPHVVHFHGPWADESVVERSGGVAVRAKRHLERRVYATGDRFITLSQAFADILPERYGVDPERVRVVPGGVDVERFDTGLSRESARQQLGWDPQRPTVLCVRRLVHRMGLEQLLDAVAEVKNRHPGIQVFLAGKGPLTPTLENAIEQKGLAGCVRLLGFVPDDLLPIAYRAADLSLVPSQSLEGFGLIIPESLAAGTPALVTPVGGMPEVVRGLDPKLILAGIGTDALAVGLGEALDKPHLLPTETACQAYARERFAWPVIAQQVLAVYREAIAAHG